jgi:hypothetical protein
MPPLAPILSPRYSEGEAACRLDLEGIVAKRKTDRYADDVDEVPQVGPGIKSKYLVLGYPRTGLKHDPRRNVITPEPFICTANPRATLTTLPWA